LRTGATVAGFAWARSASGVRSSGREERSSSVRFNALSMADIAAETGSVAAFCFAI